MVKNLPVMLKMQKTPQDQSLGCKDPLEEGTTTQSSILALASPWTEDSGRLQSLQGLTESGKLK